MPSIPHTALISLNGGVSYPSLCTAIFLSKPGIISIHMRSKKLDKLRTIPETLNVNDKSRQQEQIAVLKLKSIRTRKNYEQCNASFCLSRYPVSQDTDEKLKNITPRLMAKQS